MTGIYVELNQPHALLIPTIAIGFEDDGSFWIGLGWLSYEIGYRWDTGGWINPELTKEKQ